MDGRSLEKVASLAFVQSTYSVLSFLRDSQKARSSDSLENLGMSSNRLLTDGSLLPAHVVRCDADFLVDLAG